MSFTFNISPVRADWPAMIGGSEAFPLYNLGPETIYPTASSFDTGSIIALYAEQKRYSFYYFEVYPPNTIAQSIWWYPTKGFTASFDPNTKVRMNAAEDHVGMWSKVRARYQV